MNDLILKARRALQMHEVPPELEPYPYEKEVGDGTYGKVYLTKDGQFAVKVAPKRGIEECTRIRREIEIQSKISMKYIVPLITSCEDNHNFYMVMKYYPGRDFFYFKFSQLSEEKIIKYISQLVEAVAYLHSENIIHRDIKPENILLDSDDNIGLCDFGFATPVNRLNKSGVGTFDYAAPEIYDMEEYDFGVDLWGIGVVTYELLTRKSPFLGRNTDITRRNILEVNLTYPDSLSLESVNFMKSVLKRPASERTKAKDLLLHPWLQKKQ